MRTILTLLILLALRPSVSHCQSEAFDTVKSRWQIQLHYQLPKATPANLVAHPINQSLATSYATNIIIPELQLYPTGFLKRLNVRRIYLVHGLQADSSDCSGTSLPLDGTIYLDVSASYAYRDLQAATLHHEIFHFVDSKCNRTENDLEWCKLNPETFRYGKHHTESKHGFVSDYAMHSASEDKAETFSAMMTTGALNAVAVRDPVIANKYKRIRDRMGKFCSSCDKQYWQKIYSRDVLEYNAVQQVYSLSLLYPLWRKQLKAATAPIQAQQDSDSGITK